MSYSIGEIENHLTGMAHGATLNKVRNKYQLFERAANAVLSKIDPVTTIRLQGLSQTVHDDVFNYALPTDYKKPIDLIPQDKRNLSDYARREFLTNFDLKKAIQNKTIAIDGLNGTKVLRANWRTTPPKTIHNMNSLTDNGTWAAVAGATNLVADEIYKYTGSASIRFDVAATGDGIDNTTLDAIDLSDWDEIADFFVWVYMPTVVTSATFIFGNDLTTDYWTTVAQTTQADGTAFREGWNLLRFPWSTATETGTVAPANIDSAKITFAVASAISAIRVDNITVSVGRPFDIKYYSGYLFQTSGGTWIKQPTTDTDVLQLDEMGLNIFLNEALMEIAQQTEGEDSTFDITIARERLNGDGTSSDPVMRYGLYATYRAEYPSQSKKAVGSYFSPPRFKR